MKVIKKLLLFGLIALPSLLINFSSAWYSRDISVYGYSPFDNTLNIAVALKGQLTTNNSSISKDMLYFEYLPRNNKVRAFFRTPDGFPYFYIHSNDGFIDGVPNVYFLCDELSGSLDGSPSHCTGYDLTLSDNSYIKNYLSTVGNNNIWSFNAPANGYGLSICFESDYYDNSLCFGASTNSASSTNPVTLRACKTCIITGTSYGLSTGLSFNDFPTNILGQSPGVTGTPQQQTTQTNQYNCQTVQQIINTYPEQYNTGLCYSNNIIYTGGSIQTITPKTIFEVFPTFNEFRNGINNYYNYCKPPATQEACNQTFETNIEGRQIINKIPDNIQALKLYQYCNLTLNLDPNGTTCVYTTGTIQGTGVTINDIITEIGNGNYTITTPGIPPIATTGNAGTGSVFDRITQEEDETKRRNIIQNAQNVIETMKSLYSKMTGIFRYRQGKTGLIPRYITSLILLFILYKLFKK